MLDETLVERLDEYEIGPKVRALRNERKLGLAQLGEHTGLSPAMLSKIERGKHYPTLPTLLRIAMVFGVGLERFFVESEPRIAVVRRATRMRLPSQPNETNPSYTFESLDFLANDRKSSAFLAEFQPNSPASAPHQHDGEEFIYVLAGRLIVDFDGDERALDEDDSVTFDADIPHSYRYGSQEGCSAIVFVTPPTR